MPRSTITAPLSPSTVNPMTDDPLDLDVERNYGEILARAGARRVSGRKIVHDLPIGAPFYDARRKRWVQNTKTFPVAMSAEEARALTKSTGERHDYYEPGVICDACTRVDPAFVLAGWVLGGRKFQAEHAHVTNFDQSVYGVVEVDPPATGDEDDLPLPMEA